MLKTLKTLFKQDKEKFVVPKSVQAIIPIKTIWEDGIFLVGSNKYAKTFKFEDINYSVASREDKEAMFLEYSELLNSLDSGATTKITVNNRRRNPSRKRRILRAELHQQKYDYRKPPPYAQRQLVHLRRIRRGKILHGKRRNGKYHSHRPQCRCYYH